MQVSEITSEAHRCEKCKGPVHERLDMPGWWCLLCGATEIFHLSDRGYQPCSGGSCEYGWDLKLNRSCRKCGGKGLELKSPTPTIPT